MTVGEAETSKIKQKSVNQENRLNTWGSSKDREVWLT
jgi:hypothetical protein